VVLLHLGVVLMAKAVVRLGHISKFFTGAKFQNFFCRF
jgi:hypothetical protein